MIRRPRPAAAGLAVAVVIALIAGLLATQWRGGGSRALASTPTAHHFGGTPRVGALFLPHFYPGLHTCTASVVRSRGRDVIMTAAHCVSGTGAGYTFVPGYHGGSTPYGEWQVTRAYGDRAWLRHQDPHRDWAFLVVAPHRRGGRTVQLQDVTGGYRMGTTARRHAVVHVPGYGAGTADRPLTCRARVYRHRGYPAFDCGGYVGGTSGSPWLAERHGRRHVTGVIGGLHQGGCSSSTSYSAPLGDPARGTLRRASRGRAGDHFPAAGSDGC